MKSTELSPNSFGYFLMAELKSREWTQKDLSEITSLPESCISKICAEKQPLSPETASAIANAFGMSPEYLLGLEFDLKMLTAKTYKGKNEDLIRLKAKCKDILPLAELHKKEWLNGDNSLSGIKKDLRSIFSTDNVEELLKQSNSMAFAARQTKFDEKLTKPYCSAWFAYAKKIAKRRKVSFGYDRELLKKLAQELWSYTSKKEGVAEFLEELSKCGVTFFTLAHLQKTYLDGASFVIEGAPYIVYTARYDRIDNFWFVISHEIAHILKHFDILEKGILEIKFENASTATIEKEADKIANIILKKDTVINAYKHLNGSYLTDNKIFILEKETGLGIWVIMGMLAHENIIEYRLAGRYTSEKVLQLIPEEYNANPKIA